MNQNPNLTPTLIDAADVPPSPVMGTDPVIYADFAAPSLSAQANIFPRAVDVSTGPTKTPNMFDAVRSLQPGQVTVERGKRGTGVVDLFSMQPSPEAPSAEHSSPVAELAGSLALNTSVEDNTGNPSAHNPVNEAKSTFLGSRLGNNDLVGLFEDTSDFNRRVPKFGEVLAATAKDSAGMYRPDEAQSKVIVESLREFGVSPESPSRDVAGEVAIAKQRVASGADARLLESLEFMPDSIYAAMVTGAKKTMIALDAGSTVEVPARQLIGAEGFDSWMGRGQNGMGEVSTKQERETGRDTRTSIEQIRDYATRESDLPVLGPPGLGMILTDKGAVYYGHNSHRAAAAQLRDGVLRTRHLHIYDVRGLSEKSRLVDQALEIVERNRSI